MKQMALQSFSLDYYLCLREHGQAIYRDAVPIAMPLVWWDAATCAGDFDLRVRRCEFGGRVARDARKAEKVTLEGGTW